MCICVCVGVHACACACVHAGSFGGQRYQIPGAGVTNDCEQPQVCAGN